MAPTGVRPVVSRRHGFDALPVSPGCGSFERLARRFWPGAARRSLTVRLGWCALWVACSAEAKPEVLSSEPALRGAEMFQGARERARHYFVRGGRAASQGAWQQAIDAYLESYVHFAHASTLHNIGRCYYELGDTYRAVFFTARALYEPSGEDIAGLSEASRARAREQLSELLEPLGQVTLASEQALPGPVVVQVDEVPVSVVPLGDTSWLLPVPRGAGKPIVWQLQDVLLLEPGSHRIRVTFGGQSQSVPVEVIKDKPTAIGLEPWRTDEPAANPRHPSKVAARVVGHAAATHVSTGPEPDGGSVTPLYYLALGSWAVSAASFGVALAAGLDAKATDAALVRRCAEGRCPMSYADEVERYDAAVVTTYVGLGVGALAAAVGGTLWMLDQKRDGSSLSFSVDAQYVSLSARF